MTKAKNKKPGRTRKTKPVERIPQRPTTKAAKPAHAHHHRKASTRDIAALWTAFFHWFAAHLAGSTPPRHDEKHPHAHAHFHAIGHAAAAQLAAAIKRHKVTPEQWSAYAAPVVAINRMHAHKGTGARSASTGVRSSTGWVSPLARATKVTARFGSVDSAHQVPHLGVDLRAPVGTGVVAPVDMQVYRFGQTSDGNLVVRAVAKRPDGRYPYAKEGLSNALNNFGINGQDDSGYRLEFDHLSGLPDDSPLKAWNGEPQEIRQGTVFALSGGEPGAPGSGEHTNGPHLHFAVEWVQENTLTPNAHEYVDPLVFIGDVLDEPGARQASPNNVFVDAYLVDRAAKTETKTRAVIHRSAPVAHGPHYVPPRTGPVDSGYGKPPATSFEQLMDGARELVPALNLAQPASGQGAEFLDDAEIVPLYPLSAAPFLPQSFLGAIPSLPSVLRGAGNLAKKTFDVVTTPQGIAIVQKVAGGAAQLAGFLAGIAGVAGPILAPFVSAVPYAGPVLGVVFEAAGPVGTIAAPVLGAAGGIIGSPISGAVLDRGAHAFAAGAGHLPGHFVDMNGAPVIPEPPPPPAEPLDVSALLPPL